jgi:hypothetical protein
MASVSGGSMLVGRNTPTDKSEANDRKSSLALPTIALPKGDDAICAIGERFAADLVINTDSTIVTSFTSLGCSDLGPQLALSAV